MAKDIQLNGNDLLISGGDFVIGDSDTQHVQHIIEANPGDFRESPLLAGSVDLYRNAPDDELRTFENNLRKMLKVDAFRVKELAVSRVDGQLSIKVDATRNE